LALVPHEDGVRIWMTGAGLVTALGTNRRDSWERLIQGERGISHVDLFEVSQQRAVIAGMVKGVPLPTPGGEWSRTSTFALLAAKEALAEAGVDSKSSRVGLVVASTTGGMFETEARLAKLHAEPHTFEGQKALIEMLSHPLSSTADCLYGPLGPFVHVRTICSACSSGANALAVAALWLLEGSVDAVLAGGTDGLCRLTLSGFNALAAVDPEPCRPFDRRRRGLNLGEGAGFVVLERAARARQRGQAPIAELAGWALGAEAHHITNPEATGTAAANILRRALSRAKLSPADIDYVNAHGTGTPLNDPMETSALQAALGDEVGRIPVSSSKGQLGHTLGAAGAIEAVLAAMAIKEQTLPPTAGLEEPDSRCNLVHVLGKGRPARVRAALSNSFGFGGMDSVLVLTEPELGPPHAVPGAGAGKRGGRSVVVTGASTLTPAGVLGSSESAELLAGPPRTVKAGALDIDFGPLLDPTRARRLDRPARLGTVVVERALTEAGASARVDPQEVGVILGSAFGSVDASAAFMHRVFEKGPRFASPGEFPNLVPSSPVGHVSIYLGLRGPALATADLATSGESAVLQACELVAQGEAEVVAAGSVEEASEIAERILVGLFARSQAELDMPRSEGAAAVVLEAEEHARARGARVLARVVGVYEWRNGAPSPLAAVPGPRDVQRARVILSRENGGAEGLLDASAWRDAERLSVGPRAGQHEGLGGIAIAAAVGLLGQGKAQEVLAIGLSKGRGYALMLAAP
jgi:3-oxoacyl-[acyl-carrier-protein] synthase II